MSDIEDQFQRHVKECDAKFDELEASLVKLIAAQEKSSKAIEQLIDDTQGVVELYRNAQGAITLGVALQKLGLWLIKWPVIGAGLYTMWHWIERP